MLCNCAIIGDVVSNSPLLSAPAEAVEAIHGVMPPVLFHSFYWASMIGNKDGEKLRSG